MTERNSARTLASASFIPVENWLNTSRRSGAPDVLVTQRLGRDAARAHYYSALRDVVPTAVFFDVIADALSIRDSDAFIENGPANPATCSDDAVVENDRVLD